jgi:2-polyprenyl-3-methyl-5-hydroxy-6-metoxy-1,4-benzoquinol methylase
MKTQRAQHEIEHGKFLSSGNAESTWGWGSPAGQIRAQRRAAMLINATNMKKNSKILEVGCGTGMFTEIFSTTEANILAVDISPELLEKARARKSWPTSTRFIAKGFEECNVDGPFDAVLGSSILHHLEVQQSLEKIFHMLSPGGIVAFAEPNMLNPQIFLQKNIPWLKRLMGDSPDETAFVRWQLAALLKKIGFINIQITPFDWLHPAIPSRLIQPVSLIGKLLEKIPLIREFSGSLIIQAYKPSAK